MRSALRFGLLAFSYLLVALFAMGLFLLFWALGVLGVGLG